MQHTHENSNEETHLILNEVRHQNQIPLRETSTRKKREGKTKIEFVSDETERAKTKSQRRKTIFKKVIYIYLILFLPSRF